MVDNIHVIHVHLTSLKSVRICLFTSATSHLTFAHERSVTSSGHEGTPAWTRAKPSSSRRSHRKIYRPAEARIYHNCVELAIFIGKDSVHLKFSFQTHTMINFVVATSYNNRWASCGPGTGLQAHPLKSQYRFASCQEISIYDRTLPWITMKLRIW